MTSTDAHTHIRQALEHVPMGILHFDVHNRLIFANPRAVSLCAQYDLRLHKVPSGIWLAKLRQTKTVDPHTWRTGEDAEGYECLFKSVEDGVVVYARTRSLEHALTDAFDLDPHPLIRIKSDRTMVYANPASAEILDILSMKVGSQLPASLADIELNDLTRRYSEVTVGNRSYLMHTIHVDGYDTIFLYFNDITRSKTLNKFPEQNPNPVLNLSTEGIINYANSASSAILAQWATDIGSAVPDLIKRALPKDEQPITITTTSQERVYSLTLVYVPEFEFVNVYATDMTAFYALEDARASLIRKEKLAVLGSMVAGVAHELNTPIGVTLTAAEILQEDTQSLLNDLKSGTPDAPALTDALHRLLEVADLARLNARKAADLIDSFKGIAVDQANAGVRRVNVKTYLQQIVRGLGPYLSKQKIDVRISGAEIETEISAGPFSQVITNLLQNSALHAYQGHGGTVEIIIEPKQDRDVIINVVDRGVGIAEETLHRIFEPLFTTRFGNGGSGLGLHICYTTVRDVLKGSINVDSILGEGTRFQLRLPPAETKETYPSELGV